MDYIDEERRLLQDLRNIHLPNLETVSRCSTPCPSNLNIFDRNWRKSDVTGTNLLK